MNIVCDRCSARFSVADDKIGNRTWKARCRRCGHRLVVRRAAPPAQRPSAPPARAGRSGNAQAIWYVVIGQDEVGPLTGAELRRRFAAGEILPSFYVWCEGYEEWAPIEVAPGLEDLVAPIDRRPAPGEDADADEDEDDDEVETQDTVIQHVDVEPPAGPSRPAEGTQRVSLDDVVAMYPAEDEALLTQTAPQGTANKPGHAPKVLLKGQRSEHSVLFRIGNDDEDEDEDEGEDEAPRSGEAGRVPEGTGLVDVRAMARTELERAAAGAKDKLVVSAPTTLTAPVVAPVGQRGLPRWIWGVMAGVVIGVGLVAALVTALLLRSRG
jgi:predicted Zn finger-like uncharacterized protein